jgi:hypothetical protein
VAGAVLRQPLNGFNGLMALGAMRTLYHITGDEDVGRFYYDGLLEDRGYFDAIERNISLMYFGTGTNYSNVNMAFVASYGVLRYENDGPTALRARALLEQFLYAPGLEREARGLGQSLFDFIYAGFRASGIGGAGRTARDEGTQTLREFPMPPYWTDDVINCDDAELAARRCTAIDGSTELLLSTELGWNDRVVALDPLPKALRPDDNFEWRSDPHRVNGGAGSRLNPGGGFHGAYWMGRFLKASSNGFDNISPIARPRTTPRPRADAGPGDEDAGAGDSGTESDAGAPPGGGGGCGCVVALPSAGTDGWLLLLAGIVFSLRRRRSRG